MCFIYRLQDFMTVPIVSEEVFNSMDKNKDGFVSKGELKLAQRDISMKELTSVIDSLDVDGDGKLTLEELKQALKKKSQEKTSSSCSQQRSSPKKSVKKAAEKFQDRSKNH